MLTYAGVNVLSDVLLGRFEKHSPRYWDHVLSYDYSVVFEDGEIVYFFDNIPFWRSGSRHLKIGTDPRGQANWGRRMERYCRLMVKLRARRARLSAKAGHHSAPQDQCASEAR